MYRLRNAGAPTLIPASQLLPAPHNWRFHPERQHAALRATLTEIGWLGHVLAWKRPDGRLQLIDGHLRAAELAQAGDQPISVQVVDLDEREANLALASHDYLGSLIEIDLPEMSQLAEELDAVTADMQSLLVEWQNMNADVQTPETAPPTDTPADSIAPERDAGIAEAYRILITCNDEDEQRQLLAELLDRGLQCRAIVT